MSRLNDPSSSGRAAARRYLAIESAIAGVDHVADEMERKWGRGRLRLLVDHELRQRFDDQALRLNRSIAAGDVHDVSRQAKAMQRGWRALDEAATKLGAEPLAPEIWETTTPSGEVVAVVRTNAEAAAVTRDQRAMQVWTMAEIGEVIDHYATTVGAVKRHFPGAKVEGVRMKARPSIDQEAQDEVEAALVMYDDAVTA